MLRHCDYEGERELRQADETFRGVGKDLVYRIAPSILSSHDMQCPTGHRNKNFESMSNQGVGFVV
jgi:hypothetical protein